MARWVSEFVLGTTTSRHNWNAVRRRKRGFTVVAYSMPHIIKRLYAPYVPFVPHGGKILYVIRVRPKGGPKLSTAVLSFRNDRVHNDRGSQ